MHGSLLDGSAKRVCRDLRPSIEIEPSHEPPAHRSVEKPRSDVCRQSDCDDQKHAPWQFLRHTQYIGRSQDHWPVKHVHRVGNFTHPRASRSDLPGWFTRGSEPETKCKSHQHTTFLLNSFVIVRH